MHSNHFVAFTFVATPAENSNAQFGLNVNLRYGPSPENILTRKAKFLNLYMKLSVEVSAFTQFVDLSVSYNIAYDMAMNATPSTGNNEQVCLEINNAFALQVADAGPFYQVFDKANTQTIFSSGGTVISVCGRFFCASKLPCLHLSRHANSFHWGHLNHFLAALRRLFLKGIG